MGKQIGLISTLSLLLVCFLAVDDSSGWAQCPGEKGGDGVHVLGWVSANTSEHNSLLLTPGKDKCQKQVGKVTEFSPHLGQIRCQLTEDGFQF